MNNELIKIMNEKRNQLKTSIDAKKEVFNDYLERKSNLTPKECKKAYELQEEINKLVKMHNVIYDETEKYKNLCADETKKTESEKLEKELSVKYGLIVQKESESKEFSKPKSRAKEYVIKGFAIVGAATLLAGAGHHLAKGIKSLKESYGIIATDENLNDETKTKLKPGEYGTFTDPNNFDELKNRINYIDVLDKTQMNVLKEELSSRGKKTNLIYETYTTEEKIKMLESLLGVSPVKGNDLDDYSMMMMELGINLSNHPIYKGSNNWNPVYMSLYFPDNSKASELVKEFETAYNKLAEAARNGNRELTIKYGKEFNSLYINAINYQGLYLPNGIEGNGNYTSALSIANIESEYKYAASILIRGLAAPVIEIQDEFGADGFCVPGCIDEKTGLAEEWSFAKTIREFDKGMPNQEELRSSGKVVREECLTVQYYEWLLDYYSKELGTSKVLK